jgi:UDP-N-acetylmuramate dehydrogenase
MDGAIGRDVIESLRQRFGERVRFDEPLSRHTSFRIGGPADVWVEAETIEEIRAVQRLARGSELPLLVFGIGTNVLVSDRGVRGIVLKLGRPFARLEWEPEDEVTRVRAGAAASFKKLVVEAAERVLTGLEFAEGIPGSIGGGLLMNAGAFGGEIANVVEAVVGVREDEGEVVLPRSALRFAYRHFDLPPGLVVTGVHFALAPGDAAQIHVRMDDAKRRRDAVQPLGWPNAGSIFKNPPGHHAGRLIEAAGFKGRRVGGAMVSEQHANFIVNAGGATAADVRCLMDEISEAVWKERSVRLVPEIKLIGEWERQG